VTAIEVKDAGAGKVSIHLDPDKISVSVASVTITNLPTGVTTTFGLAQIALKLTIAGGAADAYQVTAINANGQPRAITAGPVLSPNGPGSMVARALAGTIDPTRAEIDAYNAQHPDAPIVGAGRTKVMLNNLTQPASVEIPAAVIVNGGFTYAFDGGLADRYTVDVFYEDGKKVSIDIPTFRITVQNRTTGRVIRTIVAPAPPRDEPLDLGVISDDLQPPILTAGPARMTGFDSSGLLSFTFSEAMDADSLKAGIIVERVRNGQRKNVVRSVGEDFAVNRGRTRRIAAEPGTRSNCVPTCGIVRVRACRLDRGNACGKRRSRGVAVGTHNERGAQAMAEHASWIVCKRPLDFDKGSATLRQHHVERALAPLQRSCLNLGGRDRCCMNRLVSRRSFAQSGSHDRCLFVGPRFPHCLSRACFERDSSIRAPTSDLCGSLVGTRKD
jgi:hypothetical protein